MKDKKLDTITKNKNIQKVIEDNNFIIKYLDDKSGFWFEKKIKHKYIEECSIAIEEDIILVWGREPTINVSSNGFFIITQKKLTKKNLIEILDWLK